MSNISEMMKSKCMKKQHDDHTAAINHTSGVFFIGKDKDAVLNFAWGGKLNNFHLTTPPKNVIPSLMYFDFRNNFDFTCEGGYGINTQVEKSKIMTTVNFMGYDLNKLFWIFVDSWMW